jgi:hypothetical protein
METDAQKFLIELSGLRDIYLNKPTKLKNSLIYDEIQNVFELPNQVYFSSLVQKSQYLKKEYNAVIRFIENQVPEKMHLEIKLDKKTKELTMKFYIFFIF